MPSPLFSPRLSAFTLSPIPLSLLLSLCACAPRSAPPAGSPAPSAALAATAAPAFDISTEPWTFNNHPGRLITTPHYRIFTTQPDTVLTDRIPLFLETALTAYRTFLVPHGSPLPAPDLPLDTFILRSRADWAILTRQLMGDQADLYLRIPRGGFSYAGNALLFDIGAGDTLTVAAHEGWHQYTQRTFKQPLPIWMEEGLGTYFEGHRFVGPSGATPVFLPWANTERFDQLRRAEAAATLMPLAALLDQQPQDLVSGSGEIALTWYAQVWALTLFLADAEHDERAPSRFRPALQRMIRDAASGELAAHVAATLDPAHNDPSRIRRALAARRGPAVLLAYFAPSTAEFQTLARDYDAFIHRIVATGSRERILQGLPPLPN